MIPYFPAHVVNYFIFFQLYCKPKYEKTTLCYDKDGETYWEERSTATDGEAAADPMFNSNPKGANFNLQEAAEIFAAIGIPDSAVRCFNDLGKYEGAGMIFSIN